MTLQISVASTEYIRYLVTSTVAGAAYDPTGDFVQFAFTPNPQIPPTVWYSAAWEVVNGQSYAICLVGPVGVVPLTPGTWSVWIQITDNPEVPVRNVGQLVVS